MPWNSRKQLHLEGRRIQSGQQGNWHISDRCIMLYSTHKHMWAHTLNVKSWLGYMLYGNIRTTKGSFKAICFIMWVQSRFVKNNISVSIFGNTSTHLGDKFWMKFLCYCEIWRGRIRCRIHSITWINLSQLKF